jgi:hypothetical protein
MLNTSYDHGCHLANQFHLDPEEYEVLLIVASLAGFQIKATASLLSHCLISLFSRCAAHSSFRRTGWLLHVSPLDSPPSPCLVILSCRLSFCLVAPAGCCIIVLSLHRPLILSSCSAQRRQQEAGQQAARCGRRVARR